MGTIFSKIINGDIPSFKVYEDDNYYAFLDISPLKEGHTLVIPKQETDYIFDLEDDLLSGLNVVAKKVAKAIEQVVPCKRVGVVVLGLEVPHAHIHLIPLDSEQDINFSNPKLNLGNEKMQNLANRIASTIK
jgi:histidine triad (HIT) family protein